MQSIEQRGIVGLGTEAADPFDMALFGISKRLKVIVEQDSVFRQQLRTLAEAILSITEPPCVESAPDTECQTAEAETKGERSGEKTSRIRPAIPVEIREAAGLGSFITPSRPAAATAAASPNAKVEDADLPTIEKRLRLKAEAAEWCATRQRLISEGTNVQTETDPVDRQLIERAKAIDDCFLWMNHRPTVSDLALYENLAGCFKVTAEGIGLVRGILKDPERRSLEQALELLAEAQSALRCAVSQLGYKCDQDQLYTYTWLRQTCSEIQFLIRRYMKLDDLADATSWPDIGRRMEELRSRLEEARRQSRAYELRIKRIRYHLKRIADQPDADHEHDWNVVLNTIHEMVDDGVPPSDTGFRELLLPVLDMIPGIELPQNVRLVLREIDSYLASRPEVDEDPSTSEPTAEVRAVAELLRGKEMVLIGGVRRPHSVEALKRAFDLKDLIWIDTKEHESFTSFEPYVARPDAAAVLLAIRWTSHSFGEVKQYCDKYSKPLVRLPAGYNPNQVAAQILQQRGKDLAGNAGCG